VEDATDRVGGKAGAREGRTQETTDRDDIARAGTRWTMNTLPDGEIPVAKMSGLVRGDAGAMGEELRPVAG
jgi:hypothetical protein